MSESPDPKPPRNILVTGGAGFIGSAFVKRMLTEHPGYHIVVIDKLDYCSNIRNLEDVMDNPYFQFVKGDVTNYDVIEYVLQQENIDTIVHFAAETHVDNSFGKSLEFTRTNVLGTHVMLEASRRHKLLQRFVHVSTDEVYGENKGETFSELGSTLAPTNPYAATKASAEMLVQAYQASYRLPIVISRGNNVYGPRQYPEKVIPKFIHLAMRKRPLCIHGKGTQLRSYLYVDDVAEAFDIITHKGRSGEIYNIGTSSECSIEGVAKEICKNFQLDESKYITHVVDRPINDMRYFMDASKLEALGWKPRTGWKEGLQKTIAWYQENTDYWPFIEAALMAHPPVGSDRKYTMPWISISHLLVYFLFFQCLVEKEQDATVSPALVCESFILLVVECLTNNSRLGVYVLRKAKHRLLNQVIEILKLRDIVSPTVPCFQVLLGVNRLA
eukprot:m.91621 g.91621  ORF g.91621 m.91621 type:complete len:443 (-) comp13312_c0_seq5:917-2245(-)